MDRIGVGIVAWQGACDGDIAATCIRNEKTAKELAELCAPARRG